MDKIIGLEDWVMDHDTSDMERQVKVSINLQYPDIDAFKVLKPSDRKKHIDQYFRDTFQKLIGIETVKDYSLLGTPKRPRGIIINLPLNALNKFAQLEWVQHIFIEKISAAKKKRYRPTPQFFCVKMTVAIEIEGRKKGMQTVEDRFVLVRANSQEDACQKIEHQKDEYAKPYLNSDGLLVRWYIESLDDCYETGVNTLSDFNKPEGVEVYSKFRSRKLNPERVWDGK